MAKLSTQQSEEQLVQVLKEINEQAEDCFKQGKSNLERVRDLGERLTVAKSLVKHGQWKTWAHENLKKFSLDSGQRFMRIDREWDKIKTAPVPLLGVKEAIAYLSSLNKKPVPKPKTAKQQAEKGLKGLQTVAETLEFLGVHEANSDALGVLKGELLRFTEDEAAEHTDTVEHTDTDEQPAADKPTEPIVDGGEEMTSWLA